MHTNTHTYLYGPIFDIDTHTHTDAHTHVHAVVNTQVIWLAYTVICAGAPHVAAVNCIRTISVAIARHFYHIAFLVFVVSVCVDVKLVGQVRFASVAALKQCAQARVWFSFTTFSTCCIAACISSFLFNDLTICTCCYCFFFVFFFSFFVLL